MCFPRLSSTAFVFIAVLGAGFPVEVSQVHLQLASSFSIGEGLELCRKTAENFDSKRKTVHETSGMFYSRGSFSHVFLSNESIDHL